VRNGDCEIRRDLQNASLQLQVQLNFQAEAEAEGEGKGKGKGRAVCQLVKRIDMWEFGSLRFASACERGGSRCARIEFRRGLEDPACQTWSYRDPEFLCRFIPADAVVARIWRRQCWENRRPNIAVGWRDSREGAKIAT
jgi:hypothetical protein